MNDIVGVEVNSKKPGSFVVYSYPRPKPNKPRERKIFRFACDEEKVKQWVHDIQCVLTGVSLKGTYN